MLEVFKVSNCSFRKYDIKLIPYRLHSMISSTDQEKIFTRPPPNCRKVILSTNIAESSITVPDVKYGIVFQLLVCRGITAIRFLDFSN